MLRLPAPQAWRAPAVLRPEVTLAHERASIATRRIYITRPRLASIAPSGARLEPHFFYERTPGRWRNTDIGRREQRTWQRQGSCIRIHIHHKMKRDKRLTLFNSQLSAPLIARRRWSFRWRAPIPDAAIFPRTCSTCIGSSCSTACTCTWGSCNTWAPVTANRARTSRPTFRTPAAATGSCVQTDTDLHTARVPVYRPPPFPAKTRHSTPY